MIKRLSEHYRNNKYFIPLAFLILLTLIVLNIWYWNELKRKKEELFFNEVSLYNQIIQSGIVRDIKSIVSGRPINTFDNNLIFSSTELDNNQMTQEEVNIAPHLIKISSSNRLITLDTVTLKEYFDNLLPQHLNIGVVIGSFQLIKRDFKESKYAKCKENTLGNGLKLNISLDLDINSEFYLEEQRRNKKEFYKFLIISSVISAFLLFISFFCYLKLSKNNNLLSSTLEKKKKKLQAHVSKLQVMSNINNLFVKSATEIYLNEEGKSDKKQLFPLLLKDKTTSEVNIDQLIKDIQQNFFIYFDNVSLKFVTEKNIDSYPVGRGVIYQIIFSIIQAIILIIKDQSDNKKEIKIIFQYPEIFFEFTSFPMDIEKVKKMSRIANRGEKDVFFLDFEMILLSLKRNNIEHAFYNNRNCNIFSISFVENIQKDAKIINFQKTKRSNR